MTWDNPRADASARLNAEAAAANAVRPERLTMWSHRPRFVHLGVFFAAYFLGCAFAEVLGIVPGTDIAIWPPGGVFLATLIVTPRQTWPWWVLAGCGAEMLSQFIWFHSPVVAGLLMYAGNAVAAVAGAYLVNRFARRTVRLDTLREVLAFVVLGAVIAPALSATIGAAAIDWYDVRSQTFAEAWPLWWIGDATGVLIVAPFALAVLQNWRGATPLTVGRWVEAAALGFVLLGVAAFSLSGPLPFTYLIMPPLLWAAVRFEFRGAVVALAILAFITIAFTISGSGQFAGDTESQRENLIMLQLFLAISALSALIVAAISRQHQQALLTLRESEQELRQLVDVVPVAIARLAPDGNPTFFNKGLINFLGSNIADIETQDRSLREAVLAASVHPDDVADVSAALDHALATGEPFLRKYRMRHESGVYRWVENRIEPLRDQTGAAVQWYGVCVDIDDQMRLFSEVAEREAKIRRLVDSDIIGIVIWDLDGRVIDANDAFLRIIQYTRQDIEAGLRWLDITPPDWQRVHAIEEAAELARTGKMEPREKEYFRKDGSRVPVLIGAACFEGQSTQGVAFILDLTERKRAEAALRERERELHQTRERLAHASQAASLAELSASIAHEVNQPLAAVVANSHACQRWIMADPPNLERAQTTVERIIRDANGAADVVGRIRALFKQNVRARSGSSLATVIADAERWVSDLAARHGVTLDMHIDADVPPVAIDQVQIQQVLINLMRNAVEAMAANSNSKTLAVRASRDGGGVRIEVSDTGPGIEDVEKIFEAFFTTKDSGMGMGLAVSRSIVESHGGRLWAEQNANGGARFVFILPVEASAAVTVS